MTTEKQETFFDLITQAAEMLMDRSKAEQDLIYHIAMMEGETRAAIILAYQNLYRKDYE